MGDTLEFRLKSQDVATLLLEPFHFSIDAFQLELGLIPQGLAFAHARGLGFRTNVRLSELLDVDAVFLTIDELYLKEILNETPFRVSVMIQEIDETI